VAPQTCGPDLTALADDRGAGVHLRGSFAAETERMAGGLGRPSTGAGNGPGDIVAVVAKNSADFLGARRSR